METSGLSLFFSFSFSFLFLHTVLCVHVCPPSSCYGIGLPVIRFPFRQRDEQDDRCGFPGFDLFCNNRSQTLINLPSGQFVVRRINYGSQWININDPGFCLAKRILELDLTGSKFGARYTRSVTFANCTSSKWPPPYVTYKETTIKCLSGDNYTVVAMDSSYATYLPSLCRNISTVDVPVDQYTSYRSYSSLDLNHGLQLSWSEPNCGACFANKGICGFKKETGLDIICSGPPKTGLPRSAKYGLIFGAGIPGLVCIIGLACYIGGKVRTYGHRSQLNTELSTATMTTQPTLATTGLDGPTIESYPKTVLGDSGQLPKPNEGPCSICLCEYMPKETLRTIPECNHYFHANCIDEWLKLNATCPLCRTPPEGSVVTPSSPRSSVLSSSSSSSS